MDEIEALYALWGHKTKGLAQSNKSFEPWKTSSPNQTFYAMQTNLFQAHSMYLNPSPLNQPYYDLFTSILFFIPHAFTHMHIIHSHFLAMHHFNPHFHPFTHTCTHMHSHAFQAPNILLCRAFPFHFPTLPNATSLTHAFIIHSPCIPFTFQPTCTFNHSNMQPHNHSPYPFYVTKQCHMHHSAIHSNST